MGWRGLTDGPGRRPGLAGGRSHRIAVAAALVHLLTNAVHGIAHAGLSIPIPSGTTWIVVVVVGAVPLAGMGVLAAGRTRAGVCLLVVGLLGSLVYTVAFHVVVPGPDNLASVPGSGWGIQFSASTLVATLADLVGVVAGLAGRLETRPWSGGSATRGVDRGPGR